MKRNLAIAAATALLALSLAACGAEGKDGGMPDSGNIAGGTTATDTMRNDDGNYGTGTTGGAAANDNTAKNGLGVLTGAVNSAREPTRYGMANSADAGVTGRGGAAYGVGGPNSSVYTATNHGGMERAARGRYALMLENGRVHDTDGFLLDGENSSWSTF